MKIHHKAPHKHFYMWPALQFCLDGCHYHPFQFYKHRFIQHSISAILLPLVLCNRISAVLVIGGNIYPSFPFFCMTACFPVYSVVLCLKECNLYYYFTYLRYCCYYFIWATNKYVCQCHFYLANF